ncbi:MAG TPA: adenosylmethionine--8-amino-7-oxononanoate transaminase [Polyangiaceae bacterium]|nr:adenosylmethionine--8-amino-7-oxononanoate transaminase [Polyangiaceae bacterium]
MTSDERIIAADKKHAWHPYTAMEQYIAHTEPLVVQRAQGSRLYDSSGRSYLDGNSSWWVAPLGHAHPRLIARLHAQADTLCHVSLAGITHEPGALLAEEIAAVAPAGLSRVFYSDDGTTAVEAALKMALQFWEQNGRPQRRRFVALEGAFHGETLAVSALGGIEVFRRPFAGVLIDCLRVPPGKDGERAAFDVLCAMLAEHQDEIAGVIVEPMLQGAAGMRLYGAEYLKRVREVTREHDLLLICDEVFTGYGRTGPMWASEHAGIAPDLMCLAKGFSGGILPMAATLASERIFAGFNGGKERAFLHGHSYCGHPLGAAIAREVLAIYREEKVLENAQPKAATIAARFAKLAELSGVEEVRSLGMMGALTLRQAQGKPPAASSGTPQTGYLAEQGWRVYDEALKRGAYLRPIGNIVYIAPPLNITDADLDELLGILEDSLRAVLGA